MTADVTILIPTRERADYLRIALHSVLASAAEAAIAGISTRILVVDDASPTDATRRLCAELGVDYERIEVHSGEKNPAAAIVRGISVTDSTFVSLFGDDDVMLTRFVRAHVDALRASDGFDLCSSAFLRTDAQLRPNREVVLPEPSLGDLLEGRVTINDGAMTRTALVRDLAWDPSLAQQVLYPIWFELLFGGARVTRITEPTFLYRRHDENISDNIPEAEMERRRALAATFRERVLARDGVLPPPSVAKPASAAAPGPGGQGAAGSRGRPPAPAWRRAASRVKRTLTRR